MIIKAGDSLFSAVLKLAAAGIVLLFFSMVLYLILGSWESLHRLGSWDIEFLWRRDWNPVKSQFGALPVLVGTTASSLVAVLLSAPLSIGAALFLSELVPQKNLYKKLTKLIAFLIQMLAAIPSIVYGLWGIFVLAPWLRVIVEPFLAKYLGGVLFREPFYGVGLFAAAIVLAIMITPTIFSITLEVFRSIPIVQREAALALGATRWEMIQIAVLKTARSGITGGVIFGLGRALGETMAVTMVIGNRTELPSSLFAPGQTMASIIANEYAEASSHLHLAALMEIGLLLLTVTFLVNSIARWVILKDYPKK